MNDYSILQSVKAMPLSIVPGLVDDLVDELADFNAVKVDQPEIYLSEDTKDKFAKPDALKAC